MEEKLEERLKPLMLWDSDFVSERDWRVVCEALGLPQETNEVELKCLVIAHFLRNRDTMPPEELSRAGDAQQPCGMCINAKTDPELTSENDLCFHTVGRAANGYRIMIRSGGGKPVQVLLEQWLIDHWSLVGWYEPKFCPNCGRRLDEYSTEKGART